MKLFKWNEDRNDPSQRDGYIGYFDMLFIFPETYIGATKKIEDFCISHTIERPYWFNWSRLYFKSKDDAMRFKLSWDE